MTIQYSEEPNLNAAEFVGVLRRSTLSERRPVDDIHTIEQMLRGAGVIVVARNEKGLVVGVARSITDGAYCTYLSDLAVDVEYQRKGIGRELIRRTHAIAGEATSLILLAAPAAEEYYGHIGMEQHNSCWMIRSHKTLPGSRLDQEAGKDAKADSLNSDTSRIDAGVEGFFDSIAQDYDKAIARCVPRYDEMLTQLFYYLPSGFEPKRVLELGCGTGNLTVRIEKQFPNATIEAVDVSQDSLDLCRSRLSDGSRHVMTKSDFRMLNYEADSFDLIVSTISLHHLTSSEKQSLFDNCVRWLCSKGILSYSDQFAGAASDIYAKHMDGWKAYSRSAGASEREWEVWMEHQAEHDYHDSLPDQLDWLRQAGFSMVDCVWRNLLWTIMQARKE